MQGSFLLSCPDKCSIIHEITALIARHQASVLSCDIHTDRDDPAGPQLLCRTAFEFDPAVWGREQMQHDFAGLAGSFRAPQWKVHVPGADRRLRVGVLVSWQDHVLLDLLNRWHAGDVDVDVTCVISNHWRDTGTHFSQVLARHGIPFRFLPITEGKGAQEAEVLRAVVGTDFLVLARYMQVLSGDFLRDYGRDVINIHHGLLPSFKGANPYKQAYQAGVKMIGASSHFVTETLDEGPLIEQLVTRVSHRDSLAQFAQESQDLERQCLANAVQKYVQRRLLRISYNRVAVMN